MSSPPAPPSAPARAEPWLRGPVEGVDPYLTPSAHALLQAREDLPRAVDGITTAQLWARPGGAASLGFHVLHVAGSIERLLAYARGETLDERLRRDLGAEAEPQPGLDAAMLVVRAQEAIDRAIDQMRLTPHGSLLEARRVGRAGAPSTVLGLLFHLAEHAVCHAGQALTTARILRAVAAIAPEPPA
jgi:uncharacterized damage-inducible protein DinB